MVLLLASCGIVKVLGSIKGVQQNCIIWKFWTTRVKLYLKPVMDNAGLHLLELLSIIWGSGWGWGWLNLIYHCLVMLFILHKWQLLKIVVFIIIPPPRYLWNDVVCRHFLVWMISNVYLFYVVSNFMQRVVSYPLHTPSISIHVWSVIEN